MGILSDLWNKAKGTKTVVEEPKSLDNDSKNLFARIAANENEIKALENNKHIVCNGAKIPIKWPKVVLWTENGGLSLPKKCYQVQKSRQPIMFVAHWDVCLSTKSMVNVLIDRGLSVHFGIDNDGTIYQLLDTKEIAWHAKGVNTKSVGVEIANGVSLKYNDHYKKIGLPPRPVIQSEIIHGREIGPFLGFYPAQIAAFKALTEALHNAHKISLNVPVDANGKLLKGVSDEVAANTFNGVVGHYHVTTNKTDPGNLPLQEVVTEISNEILHKV
jgi:N-acetyl-anhydromuramyl-L-alanine amidase AmpD